MAPGALEQAYTSKAGAGLIAIELKSGKIGHQSLSFQDLTSWIPMEARGNIRVALESSDGDDFHSFCQSVVRNAGEPYGETFLDRDKVVGRSLTVRFFTRAPGPPGLQNPEWLLMVRTVKLTLVGVQPRQLARESSAAGSTLPFFGQARLPEVIGVFAADLSGGTPQQWTLQVAHVRYLLELEMASGTYDMDTGNIKPLEQVATFFNFEVSNEGGGGASLFSRLAAQLEYAATSALSIAQRSTSWLTRTSLRIAHEWWIHLNDDDTVSLCDVLRFQLLGGLSSSLMMNFVAGKVGFSHGGLDFLYFIADPEQPLDRILRATLVRIASAKTRGDFDVHRPFVGHVVSGTWDGVDFHAVCMKLPLDIVGKKVSSEKDVSELFEKLKISPGGGHLRDGSVTFSVGKSGQQPSRDSQDW
jgi:hypothetical protein